MRVWADKVLETSTTAGTGMMWLAGAVTGYRPFGDVMAIGDECLYSITAIGEDGLPTADWETGLGSFDGAAITRVEVHSSSNAGELVDFPAGTKRVALCLTAAVVDAMVQLPEDGVPGNMLQMSPMGGLMAVDPLAGITVPGPDSGVPYGAHLYWRVKVTSTESGAYALINELRMREFPSGADVTTGGFATAGSYSPGQLADMGFDGSSVTFWESEANALTAGTAWLGYGFAAAIAIAEVEIEVDGTTYPVEYPLAGAIEYSDDGSTWTEAWTFSGLDYTGQTIQTLTSPDFVMSVEMLHFVRDSGADAGHMLVKNSSAPGDFGWVAPSGGGGSAEYRVGFFFTTSPAANEVLLLHAVSADMVLADDFAGAVGVIGTNPAATFTMAVKKNGADVGTIAVSSAGAITFATTGTSVSFAAGDLLSVVAPAGVAAIANAAITLVGALV